MGPIIGIGFSIGTYNVRLLKRSISNYLVATVISVVTAAIYFFVTPLNEAQSELLSRTSPSLYDVLIALLGGAAGILAICTKGKGNVIPGVAIATALMPPLCTAGYGLAVGRMSFFFGAFYLFFINSVFIALATFIGVKMLKFKTRQINKSSRLAKVSRYIIGIVVITMLPAAYMTVQIIRQSVLNNNIRKFVKNELNFKGTQIISQHHDESNKTLNIVAVGKIISAEDINKASALMDDYQIDDYSLNIIQGSQSDSLFLLNNALNDATINTQANQQKLLEQANQIYELENRLDSYERYTKLGEDIRNEVKAVCPSVTAISLSKVSEAKTDTVETHQYVVAVIGCKQELTTDENIRLHDWLKARTKADSLRLIVAQ
jgi:uncharacterized hydrophobic protein (TIGR00271 family)